MHDLFDKYALYCSNSRIVTLKEFQKFLIRVQNDPMGNNETEVSSFIRDYLSDPQRDVQEPYFTLAEVSFKLTIL